MDNNINDEVTMIYQIFIVYEIQCRFLKHPDEKRIFSFVKEFFDGNQIGESIFWERLREL